jgi:hypothetical protein
MKADSSQQLTWLWLARQQERLLCDHQFLGFASQSFPIGNESSLNAHYQLF